MVDHLVESLRDPVLYEVGHDDQVDRPIAGVEKEEHEREDVSCCAGEAQFEACQLGLLMTILAGY